MRVETTEKGYFSSIIFFFNAHFGFTNLEIKVLGAFMYHYMKYDQLPEEIRWKLAFSTDTRKEIRAELEMDTNTFNTTLHKLKHKEIASLGGPAIIQEGHKYSIHKNLLFAKDYEVRVKFVIKEEDEVASQAEEDNSGDSREISDSRRSSVEHVEESVQVHDSHEQEKHGFQV